MKESETMSAWRAEEVKNWTQALRNLTSDVGGAGYDREIAAIEAKIQTLLGIADDEGGK